MKKKSASQSGIFNLRVLTAISLGAVGCILALAAGGTIPAPFGESRTETRSVAVKSGPGSHQSLLASLKRMLTARGGAAKTVSGGPPTADRGGQMPGTAASARNIRIKEQRNQLGQIVYSVSPSNFDISPPLTELAKISLPEPKEEQLPELPLPPSRILRSARPDPVTQVAPAPRDVSRPAAPTTAVTGFNFDGVAGSLTGGYPPDTNGSVGNDQYVETVNTSYQVWSLNRATNTATSILGPVNINTLWAGFGGACQSQNSGDPVVLYDKVANRWLISQFTSSVSGGFYYQCVAISTTANATGTLCSLCLCRAQWQFRRLSALRCLDRRLLRNGPPFYRLFRHAQLCGRRVRRHGSD